LFFLKKITKLSKDTGEGVSFNSVEMNQSYGIELYF